MPCPCLTPFALIMYFRFVWLLPWFGYVWIFTVQTKRHAALFALAWPLALIQRKRALQFLWPTWSRRDVAQEHSCTRLVMKHRCCKAYRMNQNDRIIICEDVAVQLHRFDTQMLHGLRRVWHSQNQCPLAESGWKTSPVLLEKYYKYMNHTYKYENEHIACWWTLPTILVFYTSELGNCKIARNFINCMQY